MYFYPKIIFNYFLNIKLLYIFANKKILVKYIFVYCIKKLKKMKLFYFITYFKIKNNNN